MAEARMRSEWDQTALLWQALAEPNRDREERSEPYTIFDVHPFRTDDRTIGEKTGGADIGIFALTMLLPEGQRQRIQAQLIAEGEHIQDGSGASPEGR